MSGVPFGNINPSNASGPLTREDFDAAVEAIKRQSDEYLRAPKGPCGCPTCVVHPKTRDRLRAEGGWAVCGSCMRPFFIDLKTLDRAIEQGGEG
jgi:hypothetical protein